MRNHPLRTAAVLPALALAVTLAGCSSSTPDAATPTTAAGPSDVGSGSASGSGATSTTAGGATEYPGGEATVDVDIASEVLTWSGTLEGECEPNPIAAFTTKVTATSAEGVELWLSLSSPSTGTFESEDPSASSSLSEVVVNFPSAVVGDTRPTVAGAPPRVESFSDPVHTVTFDNDEGTAGTVAVTRFRYPGTAFNDGTATITWSCT